MEWNTTANRYFKTGCLTRQLVWCADPQSDWPKGPRKVPNLVNRVHSTPAPHGHAGRYPPKSSATVIFFLLNRSACVSLSRN